jgi:hypothetical protein
MAGKSQSANELEKLKLLEAAAAAAGIYTLLRVCT